MKNPILRSLGHSLLVALAACGPDRSPTSPLRLEAPSLARAADLGTCTNLNAAGSTLVLHAYATGVQIYRWNGTAWTFIAPSAELYADAEGHGLIGTHYAGPTWESVSGSKVVAAVIDRCTPSPNAIPWLKLGAVSASGPGIFGRVAFIQRVNTVGGTAPTIGGSVIGEEARVPYTAEYFFYRAS